MLEQEADSLLSEVSRTMEQRARAHESALELNVAPSAEDCLRSNRSAALPRCVSPLAMACTVLLGLVMLLSSWFWFAWPTASGPYQDILGVVESSGFVTRGQWAGGTALVRTPRGDLVLVHLRSGVPVERGSRIRLRAYDSGTYTVELP